MIQIFMQIQPYMTEFACFPEDREVRIGLITCHDKLSLRILFSILRHIKPLLGYVKHTEIKIAFLIYNPVSKAVHIYLVDRNRLYVIVGLFGICKAGYQYKNK